MEDNSQNIKREVQAQLQDSLGDIQQQQQYNYSLIQSHAHTGVDSLPIQFSNIKNRVLPVAWTINGSSANTQTSYGTFFTAPFPCKVIGATEVHQAAGTDTSPVTLQLERLKPTVAHLNGNGVLITAWSLTTTANVVQAGMINPIAVNNTPVAQLDNGDRLGLIPSGTLTSVSNVTVVVTLQY